jgi:SAM-dependent methyltransferase
VTEPNPWLRISAEDYEGHMAHPAVGQLGFLADLFEESLAALRPRRIALLGCAAGNGLERVEPSGVADLLAVDINQDYLELAEARHRARLGQRLRLRCANLDDPAVAAALLAPGSFDLIHAALLFEYITPARLLPVLARALAPAGRLITLLQLGFGTHGPIVDTPFTGVRVLEPLLRLVPPDAFAAAAAGAGLAPDGEETRTLPSGKSFQLSRWRRA